MRTRGALLSFLAVAVLATAAPSGAQGIGNSCDISGTWYGGSDPMTPYQVTIVPIGAGRYSVTAQQAVDFLAAAGYNAVTSWVGEAKKKGQTYEWYLMSYWVMTGTAPALPELDIVRSRATFVDCNTLTNAIDVFGGYLQFTPQDITNEAGDVLFKGRTPFMDAMDFDVMQWIFEATGEAVLTETYRRMPVGLVPPLAFTPPPAAAAQVLKGKGKLFAPGRTKK